MAGLDCGRCGLPARPYDSRCRVCGYSVQDVISADEKRREWERTPKRMIEELEEKYKKVEADYRHHREMLSQRLKWHVLMGGVVFTLLQGLAAVHNTPLLILLDILVGSGIAIYLNRRTGGRFIGMTLYGLAAAGTQVLKLAAGPGLSSSLAAGSATTGATGLLAYGAGAFLFSLCFGILLGMWMEFDFGRHD